MRQPKPIPPDPEGYNDRRAGWAQMAIDRFIRATGTEPEDAVADLLCDLRHWCDRHNKSFGHELERSGRHYREEITPETEGLQDVPF